MNEEREFLLEIFERFGDKAQGALDFIRKNEVKNVGGNENVSKKHANNEITSEVGILPNGTYFVLKDGSFCRWDNENDEFPDKKLIAFIGISHDTHKFGVPINGNKGIWPLLNCGSNYPAKDDECMNEADAILDWDFVGATKHIQKLGTDIPLQDGEYLPTAPVFLAMYKNRIALNAMLKYAGGKEIDFSEDCWFGRRYYSLSAWFFYGNDGYLSSDYVGSSYLVQAVTLW